MTTDKDTNYNRIMLKATLNWFAAAGYPRANFMIDNDVADLPKAFADTADETGQVIMNLSWQATRDMTFEDDGIEFGCRCNGIHYDIFIPYIAILGFNTNYGFSMWNYMPTAIEPSAEDVANEDIGDTPPSEYAPKMIRLNLTREEADSTRSETVKHLKLIQNHRTPVVDQPVDPKNPSYPFPVDRFQAYNDKHKDREATQNPNKDVIFTGDAAGIEFHSRKPKQRVRPSWMTVIDGGK